MTRPSWPARPGCAPSLSPVASRRRKPWTRSRHILDAINVDLKAFDAGTYRTYCDTRLEPVLRNIRHLVQQTHVWTEITTLVIPGLNDSDAELQAIATFLAGISVDIPWHVTGFVPHYRMEDRPPTPATTLLRAWQIGRKAGLRYVYTGNVWAEPPAGRLQ